MGMEKAGKAVGVTEEKERERKRAEKGETVKEDKA